VNRKEEHKREDSKPDRNAKKYRKPKLRKFESLKRIAAIAPTIGISEI